MTDVTPPKWAEMVLSLVLGSADRQTVSGDLLEQYRESVHPARGALKADAWYVSQVIGFVWRSSRWWACLFSLSFMCRTALDWFVPTNDFYGRSAATTVAVATLLVLAGFTAAQRANRVIAGMLAGATTTFIAAFLSIAGNTTLFAIWHDPQTLAAIERSGGLSEALTLPLLVVIPGVILGGVGGTLGVAMRGARIDPI